MRVVAVKTWRRKIDFVENCMAENYISVIVKFVKNSTRCFRGQTWMARSRGHPETTGQSKKWRRCGGNLVSLTFWDALRESSFFKSSLKVNTQEKIWNFG